MLNPKGTNHLLSNRHSNSLTHIAVTTERPVQVKVVKVKKSDKGDFYKRQMAWELRDLTEVDAKDANKVRLRGQNGSLLIKTPLTFVCA